MAKTALLAEFTIRDLEVALHMPDDRTYEQIATALDTGVENVRMYAARLRKKLGKPTRLAVALWVVAHRVELQQALKQKRQAKGK